MRVVEEKKRRVQSARKEREQSMKRAKDDFMRQRSADIRASRDSLAQRKAELAKLKATRAESPKYTNDSLAEETVWLVRLEKIDQLKERDVSEETLAKCKVKEEHVQEVLEGEKQKQEILEACMEDQ